MKAGIAGAWGRSLLWRVPVGSANRDLRDRVRQLVVVGTVAGYEGLVACLGFGRLRAETRALYSLAEADTACVGVVAVAAVVVAAVLEGSCKMALDCHVVGNRQVVDAEARACSTSEAPAEAVLRSHHKKPVEAVVRTCHAVVDETSIAQAELRSRGVL